MFPVSACSPYCLIDTGVNTFGGILTKKGGVYIMKSRYKISPMASGLIRDSSDVPE